MLRKASASGRQRLQRGQTRKNSVGNEVDRGRGERGLGKQGCEIVQGFKKEPGELV